MFIQKNRRNYMNDNEKSLEFMKMLREIFGKDGDEFDEEWDEECVSENIYRPVSDIYNHSPAEKEAALKICKLLLPKEEVSVETIDEQLIEYFKKLDKIVRGYDYYAFEGEYQTFYASMLLFLDNFKVLHNASVTLAQFKTSGENKLWNYLCEEVFPYGEIYGGDDITCGNTIIYEFDK
jgi:hypothetical protein